MSVPPGTTDPLSIFVETLAQRIAEAVLAKIAPITEREPIELGGEAGKRALRLMELRAKVNLTVPEAAFVTGIGAAEIRRRCYAPESSPCHIPSSRVGRKILIPRIAIERLTTRAES